MGTYFRTNYDQLMKPLEKRMFSRIRSKLLAKAQGHVLEVGSGTGINFPLYTNVEVTAIEPDQTMRDQSMKRVKEASVPIQVEDGDAQRLKFADDTFDTVVGTLVLCSIPDPLQALQEMRRVLKSQGKFLLFEHIRSDNPVLGKTMDILTPAWKRMFDGCHLNRNTVEIIRNAGIEIESIHRMFNRIFVVIEGSNPKQSY
ncbi:class I SAM-dependent methyltransferase [Ferviditalea candida]|uniref:Class I SAM-dependent methyltransferase n=1 Tax=Ferviditalea candida TaxID=3108399 RepID=A0ABU5ZG37_9BACL|nr:class I SAM-dependent methyltransferase [Paenibacillaceae bacterium T2]